MLKFFITAQTRRGFDITYYENSTYLDSSLIFAISIPYFNFCCNQIYLAIHNRNGGEIIFQPAKMILQGKTRIKKSYKSGVATAKSEGIRGELKLQFLRWIDPFLKQRKSVSNFVMSPPDSNEGRQQLEYGEDDNNDDEESSGDEEYGNSEQKSNIPHRNQIMIQHFEL